MTKNKPQTRSQASPAGKTQANKSSDTLNREVDHIVKQVESMHVNTTLPSGGLALWPYQSKDPDSSDTSPGAATPESDGSTAGGYFAQFEGFTPQADAGFLNNFNKLRIQENWSKKEAAKHRNEAIETEFAYHFGTDYHNVARWQELCRLVGIDTEGLASITKCKKALKARKVMVNLVNLVDHLKNGTPLKKFKNFWAFQRYTLKPGRCLNRELAKKNAFVRVLMRTVV